MPAAIGDPYQRQHPYDHAEAFVDVLEPQLECFLLEPEIGDPEIHDDDHAYQARGAPMVTN
jgi:hypothetical protein